MFCMKHFFGEHAMRKIIHFPYQLVKKFTRKLWQWRTAIKFS